LELLSSLSHSYVHLEIIRPSLPLRVLWRIIDILKTFSLFQHVSQEESTHEQSFPPRLKTYKKALKLLLKAAESQNSDAMYLLGTLNFVYSSPFLDLCSLEITLNQNIAKHVNGLKSYLKKTEMQPLNIFLDSCTQQALEMQ
jgi:hypothetical protein